MSSLTSETTGRNFPDITEGKSSGAVISVDVSGRLETKQRSVHLSHEPVNNPCNSSWKQEGNVKGTGVPVFVEVTHKT